MLVREMSLAAVLPVGSVSVSTLENWTSRVRWNATTPTTRVVHVDRMLLTILLDVRGSSKRICRYKSKHVRSRMLVSVSDSTML